MINKTYSIIGLGKLGASMAAAIASRGFKVIGVDVLEKNVNLINEGHAPVEETNLENTIQMYKNNIEATSSYENAIVNSDVTFVIVPTPTESSGNFSLEYVKNAFTEIGKSLRDKKEYHLVVLTSTVLPGATRFSLIPILEKESGKKCGYDFGLCYSPEFIALGSIIHNFLNPDFNLIGEFDRESGDILEKCYKEIIENDAPNKRMSIENAELTKIAVNTFITTKITFANALAETASKIFGGDIDVVTDALGADKRIGKKYLKGGLGYGGPCFPRDNIAFNFISNAVNESSQIASATDKTNEHLTYRIASTIIQNLPPSPIVAILGLAYKPFTPVVEESHSLKLARLLKIRGAKVIGYDPLANENARKEMNEYIVVIDGLKNCIALADGVVIATPDPEFLNIDESYFGGRNVFIYDCWRLLRGELENVSNNINYMALGVNKDMKKSVQILNNLWKEEDSK